MFCLVERKVLRMKFEYYKMSILLKKSTGKRTNWAFTISGFEMDEQQVDKLVDTRSLNSTYDRKMALVVDRFTC